MDTSDTDATLIRTLPARFVLAPGGRAGKYEIVQKLGQGTFGLVFVARDTELDRLVALKLLNPVFQSNDRISARFIQEAKTSARVRHPGIVTVLDIGRVPTSTGETAYIVMELLDGESLTSRLGRSGRLAPDNVIEIGRQIAAALEAAHRAEVLHRDIKPDNIFLVRDDAVPTGERVKVLDFGLAKVPGSGSGDTSVNAVFGTPRYMSPEQCRSATQIDARSDIYALGCLLFELLAGRTPFVGDLRALIESHQLAPAPRVKAFAPDVPDALDQLLDAMLAKEPALRPQTMLEVQMALAAAGAVRTGVAATLQPMPAQAPALTPPIQPPLPAIPPLPTFRRPRVRSPFKAALVAAVIISATLAALTSAARVHQAEAAVPTANAPAPTR